MGTRIYVDTSGVLKLFLHEAETADLWDWLAGHDAQPELVSSSLLRAELLRGLRRAAPSTVPSAERFLATEVDYVHIDEPLLDSASRVPPSRLGTLDSIHLAGALEIKASIDTFLTYDKVLAEAATSAGFTVVSPGAA